MLSEILWQYLDVSSILAILGAIVAGFKYGRNYFGKIFDNLESVSNDLVDVNSKLDSIQEHSKKVELSLMSNDITLMIKTGMPEQDVLYLYDLYQEHGGNSYISKLVADYISEEDAEVL